MFALLIVWFRFKEVQYGKRMILLHASMNLIKLLPESVLSFPSIGIQLETHQGFSILGQRIITTGVSRSFIPISGISDIVINEGLCGWNVRRYMAVLSAGEARLEVIFQVGKYDEKLKTTDRIYFVGS
jgi:hypothetical protein